MIGYFTGWRKSSYSGTDTDCVEVGSARELVGVRDTKDREGGTLVFARPVFRSFLAVVQRGDLG